MQVAQPTHANLLCRPWVTLRISVIFVILFAISYRTIHREHEKFNIYREVRGILWVPTQNKIISFVSDA